jgi:hypothetical protein
VSKKKQREQTSSDRQNRWQTKLGTRGSDRAAGVGEQVVEELDHGKERNKDDIAELWRKFTKEVLILGVLPSVKMASAQ